ncbi:MAG: sulfite exporter TauE/SafE family protein [Sulfurovaceae bacterium]
MKPFFYGALIGILGGLMGLGGAEFRLPVLTLLFDFATLHAIVINLVISFVTVAFSLLFRLESIEWLIPYLPIVFTLLIGSLAGASIGVGIASRINEKKLDKIVAILLGIIALVIISESFIELHDIVWNPTVQMAVGIIAGVVIGMFSSMLGVAGGELIIPTIILLYGIDIKIAGTLSLAVSLPTILVGLYRYHTKEPFKILHPNMIFILWMALGSILGAAMGKTMMGVISSEMLRAILAVILTISAIKLYRKAKQ